MKIPVSFSHLKPFDIIPMYEYVRLEDRAFQNILIDFKVNTVCYVDNAMCTEGVNRTEDKVYKYLPPKAFANSFRPNYYISDDKGIQTLFHRQAETRRIQVNRQMVYVNFPIKTLHNYVKKIYTFNTNFDILDSYLAELNNIGWTGSNLVKLREEYNEKYSKDISTASEEHWNYDAFIELHYYYKKYGFLTIPVQDKHPEYFKGSTHTFFHLNYLKAEYIPVFMPIPEKENQIYMNKWYGYISPQSIDNNNGFIFYIDLTEKAFYGKVFSTETVTNHILAIRNNRIEDDFYNNLDKLV